MNSVRALLALGALLGMAAVAWLVMIGVIRLILWLAGVA